MIVCIARSAVSPISKISQSAESAKCIQFRKNCLILVAVLSEKTYTASPDITFDTRYLLGVTLCSLVSHCSAKLSQKMKSTHARPDPRIHQQHQHNKVQMGSRESRAVVWCGGGVYSATRPGNAKYSAESLSHHIRRGPARLQGYKLPILTFEPSNFVDFPYPPPHPNICWPTTTTLPAPYHGFPPHPCYPSPRQAAP